MASLQRRRRASGLAVATFLGLAVATGTGVAAADAADGGSGPASGPDSDAGMDTATPTTTATTTTTTTGSASGGASESGSDAEKAKPTSTVSSSGGAHTSTYGTTSEEKSTDDESDPGGSDAAEPTDTTGTTGTTATPVADKSAETPVVDTPPAAESKPLSALSDQEVLAAAVATLTAPDPAPAVEPEPEPASAAARVDTTVAPVALRTAAVPTASAITLPTVPLPPLPTVPGATPSEVAAVFVLVVAKLFQTAYEGGAPLPVTLPLYLILVSAYQRLETMATNHVPTNVAYTPVAALLNVATGTISATDPDGDPLNYTVSTQPTSGSVTIVGGLVTYTASGALARDGGTDTFTVAVDDLGGIRDHFYAPDGHVSYQTISVTVPGTGINLGPTITSATYTEVNTGTGVVTGKILATDPEGDALTYIGTTASGTVVVDGEGNFTFTPSAAARHAAAAVLLPATTANLSFSVTDSHGASPLLPTALAVPVVPFNAAPTYTLTVNPPGALGIVTGAVDAADSDGDATSLSPLVVTTGKGAVAVLGSTFTYTPTAAARHDAASTTAPAGTNVDSFTLTLSDGYGGVVSVPVSVTISPTNIAPTASVPVIGLADGVGVIRGTSLGIDLDGDTLTYSLKTPPQYGSVVVYPDGTFRYLPRVSNTTLGLPTPTPDSFVVTIDDGHGGTTDSTVGTLGLGAYLDKAALTPTAGATDPSTGAVTGTANIPAADLGLFAYSSSTTTTKGTLAFSSTGWVFTPTAAARHAAARLGAPASDTSVSFDLTVTDASGYATSLGTVTVNISPLNTAPNGTATFHAPDANGVVTGSTSVTDADGDTLTYSGTAGKGTVAFTGTGFTYTPTAAARHAASTDGAGASLTQDTVTLTVADGYGGTKTFTQAVTVVPQNAVPVVSDVSKSSSGILNLTKTWTITATDSDGDTLTYTVTTLPSGGLLNVPLITGNVVTLVSIGTEAGKQFVVTVSDGHGGSVPVTLTV